MRKIKKVISFIIAIIVIISVILLNLHNIIEFQTAIVLIILTCYCAYLLGD